MGLGRVLNRPCRSCDGNRHRSGSTGLEVLTQQVKTGTRRVAVYNYKQVRIPPYSKTEYVPLFRTEKIPGTSRVPLQAG